jgi:hypothetical protein
MGSEMLSCDCDISKVSTDGYIARVIALRNSGQSKAAPPASRCNGAANANAALVR